MRVASVTSLLMVTALSAGCRSSVTARTDSEREAARAQPTLAITSPVQGAKLNQHQVFVAGSCSESLVDVVATAGNAIDDDCRDGTFLFGPVAAAPGVNTVTISASDESGSTYDATVTFEMLAGTDVMTLTEPASGANVLTSDARMVVAGRCAMRPLSIAVSGPNLTAAIDNRCALEGKFSAQITLTKDGSYSFTVTASDAGTVLATAQFVITLDRTPPAVAITSHTGNGPHLTESRHVTVSGTCGKDTKQLKASPWTVVDGDCSDGTFSVRGQDVPVGIYDVRVTATDAAGNAATRSIALTKFVAIGQATAERSDFLASGGVASPHGIWSDGTKLAVADMNQHRVLLWHTMPTANGTPPDVVLGQPNASSAAPNIGGMSAKTMYGPVGVLFAGGRLYVSDPSNHRILGWHSWPTAHGTPADFVLGQPSFDQGTPNNGGISASSLNGPREMASDGTRFAVGDIANHRVLIWNSLPTTSGQPANVVVGQPTFFTGLSNNGDVTKSMAWPAGLAMAGGKLWVASSLQQRVMVFDPIPTTNYPAASFVLGQGSTATTLPNQPEISASTLQDPRSVASDGTRLAVADTGNGRVLVWNTLPTANGTPADIVLGQTTTIETQLLVGSQVTASTLLSPLGVSFAGSKILVNDSGNHRTLGYDLAGLASGAAANIVLGRSTMTQGSRRSGLVNSLGTMGQTDAWSSPHSIVQTPSGKVIVSDTMNHRVLIYDEWSDDPRTLPSVVLGQPNRHERTENNDTAGISCRTLNLPRQVFFDGERLYVADSGNHRILIWDTLPTGPNEDQKPADRWLGQEDCKSNVPRDTDLTGSARMNAPWGVSAYRISPASTKVVVADRGNHRVLVWDNLPAVPNTAATAVIGQANATAFGPNTGGIAANRLSSPSAVHTDGTRIAISDSNNDRVLLFNSWPAPGFNQAADVILGQDVATTNSVNNGMTTNATGFNTPVGVGFYDDGVTTRLAVADQGNDRILIWDGWPAANVAVSPHDAEPADRVLGHRNFTSSTGSGSYQGVDAPTGVSVTAQGVAFTGISTTPRAGRWRDLSVASGSPPDEELAAGSLDPGALNTGGLRGDRVSRTAALCLTARIASGKLFCADTQNNRLLIWNTIPTYSGAPADVVVGQPDFVSYARNGGVSLDARGHRINRFWTDGQKLVGVDSGNNRAMIWHQIPTTNFAPADVVLGQLSPAVKEMRGSSAGDVHFCPIRSSGVAVTSDGTRLAIAAGPRIMIWNTFPTTDGAPADVVLGQPDFDDCLPNREGPTQRSLSAVQDLATSGGALYALDAGNARISKWNSWPTVDFAEPHVVTESVASGPPRARLSATPRTMIVDGSSVIVGDLTSNRVLIWDDLQTEGQPADRVWGQADFDGVDYRVPSAHHVNRPRVGGGAGYVTISSDINDRMLIMPQAAVTGGGP